MIENLNFSNLALLALSKSLTPMYTLKLGKFLVKWKGSHFQSPLRFVRRMCSHSKEQHNMMFEPLYQDSSKVSQNVGIAPQNECKANNYCRNI